MNASCDRCRQVNSDWRDWGDPVPVIEPGPDRIVDKAKRLGANVVWFVAIFLFLALIVLGSFIFDAPYT